MFYYFDMIEYTDQTLHKHAYITKALPYEVLYPKRDTIRGETYEVVNVGALKFVFIYFLDFGTPNNEQKEQRCRGR